ncbi:MAG: hypothetical protein SVU32_03475 [Candidatus Nanohaloarchaea archaeon]|nr:hypothetical protein [Candidatus Nanohaloarchaea archaeon]
MVFQLDPAFEEGSAGLSFLVTAPPAQLFSLQQATIRRAIAEGHAVAYLLTIHPYQPIAEDLPDVATPRNTHIIDCISREIDEEEIDAEHVAYVDSPNRLDQIITHLGIVAKRFDQEPVVIVLDSIRGILGYNTEEEVRSFLRRLSEKAETFDMRFKLFKSSKDLAEFEEEIDHLFEETIHVSESTSPIVAEDGQGLTLHIPSAVSQYLDWSSGDRLEADLVDGETVFLTREDQ